MGRPRCRCRRSSNRSLPFRRIPLPSCSRRGRRRNRPGRAQAPVRPRGGLRGTDLDTGHAGPAFRLVEGMACLEMGVGEDRRKPDRRAEGLRDHEGVLPDPAQSRARRGDLVGEPRPKLHRIEFLRRRLESDGRKPPLLQELRRQVRELRKQDICPFIFPEILLCRSFRRCAR